MKTVIRPKELRISTFLRNQKKVDFKLFFGVRYSALWMQVARIQMKVKMPLITFLRYQAQLC